MPVQPTLPAVALPRSRSDAAAPPRITKPAATRGSATSDHLSNHVRDHLSKHVSATMSVTGSFGGLADSDLVSDRVSDHVSGVVRRSQRPCQVYVMGSAHSDGRAEPCD
jgi:hypothetical protein